MCKKNFTLIELLIVVAIIGILASLLIPSLSRAREESRVAVCISNQSQIVLAMSMYGDDNESYFPKSNRGFGEWLIYESRTTPNGLGHLMHNGYLDNAKVLYCPSWTHPVAQWDNTDNAIGGWPAEGNSHPSAWTWASYAMRQFPELNSDRPLSFIQDPNETAILADHWTARTNSNSGWSLGNGEFGHKTRYVTSYLNGAIKVVHDKSKSLISLSVPHGRHNEIEEAWRSFFDMD